MHSCPTPAPDRSTHTAPRTPCPTAPWAPARSTPCLCLRAATRTVWIATRPSSSSRAPSGAFIRGGGDPEITRPRRPAPRKNSDPSPLACLHPTGLASTTIWVRGQTSTSASSPRTRLTTSGITSTCRASPTSAYTPWPFPPATHVCLRREGGSFFWSGGATFCMVLQCLGCASRSAFHTWSAHESDGSTSCPLS